MNYKVANLPSYLKHYVTTQDYSRYTSEEHATWRFIMRQNRAFFSKHGVNIYVDGLKKTGIPIDRIPKISEMDECLAEFGWGAVGVTGFIPSSVFLDLLARGILPIATDMRTIDHIAYTPAPDIVHEAAGHAPIIADKAYRNFLERYSEIAYRAIITKEDIYLYELIRYLSDIKENPSTPPAEVERAEKKYKVAAEGVHYLSEAARVARMAWWTIEYGLVGDIKRPKIYGAGLLSSVGESQNCLSDKVKKIPLTVRCIDTPYDITEPQPQLFVAKSLHDLPEVLNDLEKTFVYRCGGIVGLEEAKRAETINTLAFENQLGISGQLSTYELSKNGDLEFVKFSGPVQLSYLEKELSGQGRKHHPAGFSSPLGRFRNLPNKAPAKITDTELQTLGIAVGKRALLEMSSGFKISGDVRGILRQEEKLLVISWKNASVKRGDNIYFEPSWGVFDQVIGAEVVSVYCGPADRAAFGDYYVGEAQTTPGRSNHFTNIEKKRFAIYDALRQIRQDKSNKKTPEDLERLAQEVMMEHGDHWLLALEILEVARQKYYLDSSQTAWLKQLQTSCTNLAQTRMPAAAALIERGLETSAVLD